MKYLLATLAVIATLGFAIPNTAKADHSCGRRVVSYMPCGRPVYAVYQICGYDRCGQPIGHWVTQNTGCGCSVCNPVVHHHHQDNCDRGGYAGRSGYSVGSSRGGFYFSIRR